jgi:hypothetical protein
MSIPKITLTMLGATGSGKTTYLIGMYAVLSAGVNGYFMTTTDPDRDLDLADDWDLICSGTGMPNPNSDEPIEYDFVLNYGTEPILQLDCLDFRGNAAHERLGRPDTPGDVAKLHERLTRSDSIYIVVDGHLVGNWINEDCPRQDNQKINPALRYTRYVNAAVQARKEAGKPSTSLVVVVTKVDAVSAITGIPAGQAMQLVLDNIEKLAPSAKSVGVAAALCPVKLGNFGVAPSGGRFDRVDPNSIDPRFLHKPVIFSLVHYLSEQIAYSSHDLDAVARGTQEARNEIDALRGQFLGGWLNNAEIKKRRNRVRIAEESANDIRKELESARVRASKLMEELDNIPIMRDGKIQ